jgi:hypothetical protein
MLPRAAAVCGLRVGEPAGSMVMLNVTSEVLVLVSMVFEAM